MTSPKRRINDPNYPLNVAVGYEDLATALRAKRMLDGLRFRLGNGVRLELSFWRFTALQIQPVWENAARAAAAAAILVLSVHGDAALPAEAQQWVERWIDQL